MMKRQVFLTALVAFVVTCVTHLLLYNIAPTIVQAQPSDGFFNSLTVKELHVVGESQTGV